MNVLVNAYAISPFRGSEPGMGWNWCSHLAANCNLHIITEGEFRNEIERVLPDLPHASHMHFYYLPVADRVRRMCWNQGDWRFYFYYARWQKRALQLARRICTDNHIDIIHQLNMVGFREPGYLWRIEGPRYVLGPIGGMTPTPVRFFGGAPFSQLCQIVLKNIINSIQRNCSFRVASAIRKSSIVLCATPFECDIVSRRFRRPAVWISETGTDLFPAKVRRSYDAPIHIAWVGKFMHRKQLGLALHVVARLKSENIVLHVAGTGTEEEVRKYHEMANELGVTSKVVWHGQISHEEVGLLLDRSDIFLFTSIHEATSTVVMEAVSHGLPVVCFDTCGFGPLINSDIGIKIPLRNPQESISNFANALEALINDPDRCVVMSAACYDKTTSFSFEAKIKTVEQFYRQACGLKED